jgi:hypothetical protein
MIQTLCDSGFFKGLNVFAILPLLLLSDVKMQ